TPVSVAVTKTRNGLFAVFAFFEREAAPRTADVARETTADARFRPVAGASTWLFDVRLRDFTLRVAIPPPGRDPFERSGQMCLAVRRAQREAQAAGSHRDGRWADRLHQQPTLPQKRSR